MNVPLVRSVPYRVRLILPGSGGYTSRSFPFLDKTFTAYELPMQFGALGEGLVSGDYSFRDTDSGEWSMTFPNAAGALGLWRDVFNPDLALQWVEIYEGDHLEFVGVIQRMEVDEGKVEISGGDGLAMMRRVFERDRTWYDAPVDVMHYYCTVPLAKIAETFDTALSGAWATTITTGSGGTVTAGGGLLKMRTTSLCILETARDIPGGFQSQDWSASIVINRTPLDSQGYGVALRIQESGASFYRIQWDSTSGGGAEVRYEKYPGGTPIIIAQPRLPLKIVAPFTIELQGQGKWVKAFVNGQLCGFMPGDLTPYQYVIEMGLLTAGTAIDIDCATFFNQTGFLQTGTQVDGDTRLPGDYPTGGLHGRYYTNVDLASVSSDYRQGLIMNPGREPIGERLDPVLNTATTLTLPLVAGGNTEYQSVRWTGAVWLQGAANGDNYDIKMSADDRGRVWIGQTSVYAGALCDTWATGPGVTNDTGTLFTWGGDDLAGAWYPILVEWAQDAGPYSFKLEFTPHLAGGNYVDPGGTTIVNNTTVVIPATSLSPLGIYDNRVQGASAFDTLAQVAQAFGYVYKVQPVPFENTRFPGILEPLHRLGRDTDVILEAGMDDRGEPILAAGSTFDASDQAVWLRGSGAGPADGAGGQVLGEVYDLDRINSALFPLASWIDASDTGNQGLLQARLQGELALRSTAWQEVRGNPVGFPRLADTWPLSGALSAMRFEVGDGVRIDVPTVGIRDTTPRPLTQVSRSFVPAGRTGQQVGFRNRPRSAAATTRRLIRAATIPQRTYQRQKVTLTAFMRGAVITSGGYTDYAILALSPADVVLKAILRITWNSTLQALQPEINGVNRSAALSGPFPYGNTDIDVTPYAVPEGGGQWRFYARMYNGGGASTVIEHALIVEVLR